MDAEREAPERRVPEFRPRTSHFHRVAKVRLQQERSLRSISRQTGVLISTLRAQEKPDSNLTLAELYWWKEFLDVPIEHLLVDRDIPLTESLRDRACLVKIMKSVMVLSEITTSKRVMRLVSLLRTQLVELMPELDEVRSWPVSGAHRSIEQLGRVIREPISTSQLYYEP